MSALMSLFACLGIGQYCNEFYRHAVALSFAFFEVKKQNPAPVTVPQTSPIPGNNDLMFTSNSACAPPDSYPLFLG